VTHHHRPLEDQWAQGAFDDLMALNATDSALADSALAVIDDVLHHRKRGKQLGERRVSGDLSGLFRLKFDVDGQQIARYRLVYELKADTVLIWGLGLRENHAVYQSIVSRRASSGQ
jgi:hypothetical protein